MGSGDPLPYQPPRWLTPERIAKGVGAAGFAQATAQTMAEGSATLDVGLAWTLAVGLWAAVGIRLATRYGGSRRDALVGTLLWVPLVTVVGAVLVGGFGALVGGGRFSLIEAFTFSFFFAVGGYMVGFLLSLLALPLAVVVDAGRTRPSHEAPVRALIGGGAWWLTLAALCLAVTPSGSPATLAALAPGAALVAVGSAWTVLRARFIRRVRAGREPGFVIVPSEAGAVDSGLLPYRPLRGVCIVDTLAAVVPDTAPVYRGTARPIPLCLVPHLRGLS